MPKRDIHHRNSTIAGVARRSSRGFTLLELMIVVIVIAVLAVLAVSSYQFANVKARRSAAKGCMTETAQYLERFYTTNLKYTGALVPTKICDSEVQKYYTFSYSSTPDATTFTISAVPKAIQNDKMCGTLTLDQKGTKTASGTGGASACW